MNYLVSGKVPKRIGNAHANIVPYQVFPVADGYAIVATGNDNQYIKFCNVLGAPELAQNPEYKGNIGRLEHRDELIAKLSALTSKMKRDDLLAKLEAQGVPAGPINDLEQVFDDAQVKHRGMKLDLPTKAAKRGSVPGVRTPIVMDGWRAASEKPAPLLGEHTAEILREIGEG
jgi:crotonobetainyl-CoA:carnitine CoA-transferase CaiB-like acyl-CoA transferase